MISVIIPVYNAEKYLRNCIESVCNQTFRELEIILIDDGSTDQSGKLCDGFAKQDSRIVVLHKENGGATSARKAGAAVAKGEDIICVDADDWIDSAYLAQMAAKKEETGADVIASDMYYITGTAVSTQKNTCQTGVYHSHEIWHEMLFKAPFFEYGILPHLVLKLFDRKLFCNCIQEIDERIIQGEDAALTYYCLLQDVTICVSDICGYHYVQRGNSVRTRYLEDEYERCQLLFEFLEEINAHYHAEMSVQIEQYKKYLMLLRCPSKLEWNSTDQLLAPYGGISAGSKIILYGAGYMGTTLYSYLSDSEKVEIVLWTDRNYEIYRKWNMPVDAPTRIAEYSGQYDFIIIAVASERVAASIERTLRSMNIAKEKIKWLSKMFIEGS